MTSRTSDNSVSRVSVPPGTQSKLPSQADLMAGPYLGPVRNSREARKWLESKGWVLSEEPYDRSKAVRILLTAAALPKVPAETCC